MKSAPQAVRVAIGGGLRYGHDAASLCPQCLRTIPGRVAAGPAGVVMRKHCPEHGNFESLVAPTWRAANACAARRGW